MPIRYADIRKIAEERGIDRPYSTVNGMAKTTDDLSRLVAVHLTDSFPEDGVLRTTFSYDPSFWRDTLHFALNGPVSSHDWGNWDRRKYGILVPLDRLVEAISTQRIIGVHAADTYILGDIELPEETQIIVGSLTDIPKNVNGNVGKARIGLENFNGNTQLSVYQVEKRDYSSKDELEDFLQLSKITAGVEGYTVKSVDRSKRTVELHHPKKIGLSPMHAAVYRAIISKGYYPMLVGNMNWVTEEDSYVTTARDQKLREKLGLPNAYQRHGDGWLSKLELLSLFDFWLMGRNPVPVKEQVDRIVPAEYREPVMQRFYQVVQQYTGREGDAEKQAVAGILGVYLKNGELRGNRDFLDPEAIEIFASNASGANSYYRLSPELAGSMKKRIAGVISSNSHWFIELKRHLENQLYDNHSSFWLDVSRQLPKLV